MDIKVCPKYESYYFEYDPDTNYEPHSFSAHTGLKITPCLMLPTFAVWWLQHLIITN